MNSQTYPVLMGNRLFRENEMVYINKSNEQFQEYMNLMHRHDFIEIAYVISGEGQHVLGNNKYSISKGDLFIINTDTPHGFFKTDESKEPPVVYNCVFMPGFVDASLFGSINFQDITFSFLFKSLFPDNSSPLPDLTLHGADFIEFGDLFSKMHIEYKGMKKGYGDLIRAYLIELLIKIIRCMETYNQRHVSTKNTELIEKAVNYLKNNFNSDIRLEDLAIKSFTSKNYFSRLFKEVTGANFSDYVQKLRIDEACSLLKGTDMKVSDIAAHTGFNDMKFFYEVFKRITGKTPGDYRRF